MFQKIRSVLTSWSFEKKYLVAGIALHILVTACLVHRFGDHLPFFENYDAYDYTTIAQNLAAGKGFVLEGVLSAQRTPLLPLFFAPLYLFHTPVAWGVPFIQGIFALATGIMLFRLGVRFFSPSVGMIAALMYLFEPELLLASNLALTEIVFNFFIVAGVFYFLKYLADKNYGALIVAAAGVALATLTRPIGWYFPAVFIFILLIDYIARRSSFKKTLTALSTFIIVFGVVLSPWLLRQYYVFGRAAVSNIDAWMLYNRTAPIALGQQKNISYEDAARELDAALRVEAASGGQTDVAQTFRYTDFMKTQAITLIKANPLPVVRFYAFSLIPTMFGTGYDNLLEEVFGLERPVARVSYTSLLMQQKLQGLRIILGQLDIFQLVLFGGLFGWLCIYILIIYGLVRHPDSRKNWLILLTLFATIGYFVLFTLGPASQVRYRLPTFPFWFILLGYAVEAYRLTRKV